MTSRIAIVGMACCYPDASCPERLWENILAQRRSFRYIPPERLSLEDYFSSDRRAPDRTYSTQAAVIEGYEFDRLKFRVAGSTFRTTDLTHWLALDVASQALEDAGFTNGRGLPREATGVIVGNTLTGDASRASNMRLRWPYVRRVVESALNEKHWEQNATDAFLETLENAYKSPFPPVGEDTLAGGLSNTIAGRISNYFDFAGGGYTIDGACCSSLLAIANACSALVAGDIDAGLVGGVDLSIDPFELVGFAKNGALAADSMRVYDAQPQGFWPGEGCGFVVLMRHDDAIAFGCRVYSLISGWGISSDGCGGLTRPKIDGQRLALERAYRRAGFGIETVHLFEGHGTGTPVGDAVELDVLCSAREQAAPGAVPAVIGSIKANIGHTKAAAGIAGLIKATLAIHEQVLPPSAGWETPHPRLTGSAPALRLLGQAELWDPTKPLRAGVSSMGFGGINAHVVLEGYADKRRVSLTAQEISLSSSPQDAEVFFFGEPSLADLRRLVEQVLKLAPQLSLADLGDLASRLSHLPKECHLRAAIVASKPSELVCKLKILASWLNSGTENRMDIDSGIFFGSSCVLPRITFLFPGQAGPARPSGGLWRRRFDFVKDLYFNSSFATDKDIIDPSAVQPAIVTASLAALRTLEYFGIEASTGVGHSLGELTALHWARAIDEQTLLRIASARGRAMVGLCKSDGAMASISAGKADVQELFGTESVVVSCINSPKQTVVSGDALAVRTIIARAQARGWLAVLLPVTHAFHSHLVAPAVPALANCLADEEFLPLKRSVVSSVTGSILSSNEDPRRLLCRQVTSPVLFSEALAVAAKGADLLIEAGPGEVLSRLARDTVDVPSIAVDAGGPSLIGLLNAIALAFTLGAPVKTGLLFAGRFNRAFDLDWRPKFFLNPCELAPASSGHSTGPLRAISKVDFPSAGVVDRFSEVDCGVRPKEVLGVVKNLIAERAELPLSEVKDDGRLLDDFHLSSITVGQIASEAARFLRIPPPIAPTDYAGVTVAEMARALETLFVVGSAESRTQRESAPPGVESWIRNFVVEFQERALAPRKATKLESPWHLVTIENHKLAGPLRSAVVKREDLGGTVFCLLPDFDGAEEICVDLLLESARLLIAATGPSRFVLVTPEGCAGSFARTLHLEMPHVTTCVVDVPFMDPRAVDWIVEEALAADGFVESRYDSEGQRHEPFLKLLTAAQDRRLPALSPADTLLVTGGGKGIAAECAVALARDTGVRLALIGRSQPSADRDLDANLERLSAAGIHFGYISADVSDAESTRAAIREIKRTLGTVTAVIHGAGTNVPQPLRLLNKTAFLKTVASKVQGLRNVLGALDPSCMKLLLTFGSIIARSGMRGEADYAVANEWLARLTERWQSEHPQCRCIAVEWSVWSGVGMGERLGRIDALVQQGISPISPDQGVAQLRCLITKPPSAASVVVSSRFGETSTLTMDRPQIPLLRFLERPRVFYPGIELVVDSQLDVRTDPYLRDHVFQGRCLFPAVMGLEAMTQAAMCVTGVSSVPVFEDIRFAQPICVTEMLPVTLRVAALVTVPGTVEVVVRSSENAFQIDHFKATCRFITGALPQSSLGSVQETNIPSVPLVPDRDLYDGLFFQKGRFQRIHRYRKLTAKECIAEVASANSSASGNAWFGGFLPPTLTLGDAGARDAALHALQACVPNAAILPIGVGSLSFAAGPTTSGWIVHAVEQMRQGNVFTYDIEISDPSGSLIERWENVKFQVVGNGDKLPTGSKWVEPLLGPYVERCIPDLIPGIPISVVVDHGGDSGRKLRTDRAIQRVLGRNVAIRRRVDGKPEVAGDLHVSAAHSGEVTIAVASTGIAGCDIEAVTNRSTVVWRDLLGQNGFALAQVVAQRVGERFDASATRVWAAIECLKKAGATAMTPFTFSSAASDGWVVLNAGSLTAATLLASIRSSESDVALAVLGSRNGHL